MDARSWIEDTLRRAGHTPLPPNRPAFTETGFTVSEGPQPGSATLTATAQYTGQEGYDHWGEAQQLGNRLLDVLEHAGADWVEIEGREPNHVVTVYPPAAR